MAPVIAPETPRFDPNQAYWSAALPPPLAPLTGDLEADVVIIGGGFFGLSAAYYLRRRLPGLHVALLEAVRCGNGASGRNGAMVLTSTDDRYLRPSDAPAADLRLYRATARNLATLAGLAQETGIDCELERRGALQVINDPADTPARKDFVAQARDQGFPFEFWDRDRTVASIGAQGYAGAVFEPGSGQVHPGKLVAVWKAAALGAGVQIYENSPVLHVEDGPIHTLSLSDGRRVRTPRLVLATNAYTSKLGYLRQVVAPIFDNVCITAPLDDALLAKAGWRDLIPFNDSRTEVFYAGRTRDNRIHFGGGPVDYQFNNGLTPPRDMAERYAGVHLEFARRFPALAKVPFDACWNGLVDMSLDSTPAVGWLGRHGNIFYGLGFSGHGVNLTSVFGRVVADVIAGDVAAWSWLPFLNRLPPYVPNEPFRWLGVETALAVLSGR
jgi:glycine/D-amino acid oxidase-like deaminating enzyme